MNIHEAKTSSLSRLVENVAAGEHACPPEDCGGPWGYANLIAAAADPAHPEHEDVLEWLDGDAIDPAAFDFEHHAKLVRTAIAAPRRKRAPQRAG